MSSYAMSITLARPYDEVLADVRQALADQGFGILTEIDVRDILRSKLGVDVPAQVILGACRPELAHRALDAAPSLAALVPCNVAVRAVDDLVLVEAIDPSVMSGLEDREVVRAVAAEARDRLSAMLRAVSKDERAA
jgi:uncharacterized protein (DUF302 family)